MFYCDTAIQGNTPALMCAYEFFGADHMVFATDTPYDNQLGERVTRETIEGVAGDADRRGGEEEDLRRQRAAAVSAAGVGRGLGTGGWGAGGWELGAWSCALEGDRR